MIYLELAEQMAMYVAYAGAGVLMLVIAGFMLILIATGVYGVVSLVRDPKTRWTEETIQAAVAVVLVTTLLALLVSVSARAVSAVVDPQSTEQSREP